ncbi:MAG: B12-binding domain-containing radical SAM protein [Fervidobacterium sp.]
MRRPKDEESFKEYSYVQKMRATEKILENISGNLPKVALIFPNGYEIASSSLAWSWVQQLLCKKGIGVERFFYEPWFKRFYSLESQKPLDEFPIWMFTLQFENDLLNIADILVKRGIPLNSADRFDYHPLIIIGGPVTLFNYKVVEDLADFVFVGDLECSVEEFSNALDTFSESRSIDEFLKVKRVYSKKFGKINFEKCFGKLTPVPYSHYITSRSTFKNKLLVEVGRGCIWRCAFCVTGYTKKPVKFANLNDVLELMERYKELEFGLISASITDYPYLNELLEFVERNNIRFSVSSMRIDKVSYKLLDLLKRTDHQSFTVAPEGISQKMRDIMIKDLTADKIIHGLRIGREVGFESVKLYYIIGLEEESDDDYKEFFGFIKDIQKMGYKNITLSINPLVPKPMTPFEKRSIISKKDYEERMVFIRKNLHKNVKINFESYKESLVQYELSSLKGIETIEYIINHIKKEQSKA